MRPTPPLPPGWVWSELGEILTGIEAGRSFKCDERPPEHDEVGVVKVSAVTWGTFDELASKTCTEPARIEERFLIQPGDFLFSRANTIQLVGACVIVQTVSRQLMLSDKILRFRFRDVVPAWILHVLRSEWGRAEIERLATGNQESMRNIGQDRIRAVRVPIPPVAEQHSVVAEIESQSTRIEAAVACLQRAKRNLHRFRVAVLFSAISGKLVTPSSGWKTVRVDEAGEVKLGRQRAPQHQNGDHIRPYLRVANVFEDRIDTSDVLQMNFTPQEFETFKLEPGDVLLNEGQSLELVGRAAIYRGEVPGACFQNTLIRFRSGPNICPEFALIVFRAYLHSGGFRKVARWTTTIAHLGANRLAAMTISLPTREEQDAIVNDVERRLSVADSMERAIDGNLRRATRLRQSILKGAFEGRLVPQDRSDEPATQMLAAVQPNGHAISRRVVRKGSR